MPEQAGDGPPQRPMNLNEAVDRLLDEAIARLNAEHAARQVTGAGQGQARQDALAHETPEQRIARQLAQDLADQARERADGDRPPG